MRNDKKHGPLLEFTYLFINFILHRYKKCKSSILIDTQNWHSPLRLPFTYNPSKTLLKYVVYRYLYEDMFA